MGVTVDKCLQAWTNTLRQLNAKADIVFFGDSLTFYGDFASVFPDKVVCNLGLRGDTIQGMIDRVEQVRMLEPKHVFLMAGINDVSSVSTNKFEILYHSLIEAVVLAIPNTTVIVQSLLPVNSKEFVISCDNKQIEKCNQIIRKVVEKHHLQFVDLYVKYIFNGQLPVELTIDGIHLKPKAYELWCDYVNNIVTMA